MTKKKVIRKFWRIKRHFLRKSLLFSRKSAIFSRNLPKTYRNLILGFLGFFYCPILGFQFFLSGNTAWRKDGNKLDSNFRTQDQNNKIFILIKTRIVSCVAAASQLRVKARKWLTIQVLC